MSLLTKAYVSQLTKMVGDADGRCFTDTTCATVSMKQQGHVAEHVESIVQLCEFMQGLLATCLCM
jgi:hypothetical protein